MLMNPRNILQFQDDDSEVTVDKQQLFDIINSLPFVNQLDTAYLYVQYNHLLKFVFNALLESATRGDEELCSTAILLKRFVNEVHDCPELVCLLSFCVSFPVSEAIVESWGSTISHFYSIKHNPGEPSDDLLEPGTVDKLSYIRLCGPPPGMISNKRLFKDALYKHFKSDYAKHFVNTEAFNRLTSIVVCRITNPGDLSDVLPCYQ